MGLQLHKAAGLARGIGLLPQFVNGPVDLADPFVAVHHLHLHHHSRARPVKQAAAPGISHNGGIIRDPEVMGDEIIILDRPAGKADLLWQNPVHILVLCQAARLPLVKV